jgi:CrcB protein
VTRTAVLAGGAAGTLARYAVVGWFGDRSFPWATLAVNVVGSFLLGWLAGRLAAGRSLHRLVVPAVGVGAVGALTTFGGFAVEVLVLDPGPAVGYAVLSIGLGLGAAAAGLRLGEEHP